VASDGAIRARTTSAWNKLAPGSGPLDFALRNKKKLGGLALAYAAWCLALLRWRAYSTRGGGSEGGLLSHGGP
jgi:hypothetical protein